MNELPSFKQMLENSVPGYRGRAYTCKCGHVEYFKQRPDDAQCHMCRDCGKWEINDE